VLTLNGSSSLTAQCDTNIYVNAAGGVNISANGGSLALNANFEGNIGNGDLVLAGRTRFDDNSRQFATSDLNKGEQIASNNAYVPMYFVRQDLPITVNNTDTVVAEFPFTWRYSGQFGASLTSESLFCSAQKVEVNVNLVAEGINDTIAWSVKIYDDTSLLYYQPLDFIDTRFGYLQRSIQNPQSGQPNHCVSFKTVFDMTASSAPPTDGNSCKIELIARGTTTSTAPLAQITCTMRPLRNP
jgi:hypothetical protein